MSPNTFNPEVYTKALRKVRTFVLSNSGSLQDVEDVLQEGFYVYFNNLRDSKFKVTVDTEHYIFGVCKIVWLNELKRRKKGAHELTIGNELPDINEDLLHVKIRKERLLTVLEQNIKKLSEKCQDVFRFRKEGLSCDQIAQKMNWKNRQMTKDKIYRCKKRLLEFVTKDSEYTKLNCPD